MDEVKTTLVIVDEALLDEFRQLTAVLNTEEFSFQKLRLVSANDLSDHLRSGRPVHAVSTCIYATEAWTDSPENALAFSVLDQISQGAAVATVIVFCCEDGNAAVPSGRLHSKIRINISSTRGNLFDPKAPAQLHLEKMIKLLAVLEILAQNDESSYFENPGFLTADSSEFRADLRLTPNYASVFAAIKRQILSLREEILKIDAEIRSVDDTLEKISKEVPKIVQELCFCDIPALNINTDCDLKDTEAVCLKICKDFASCDSVLTEVVAADIGAIRYSMALTDAIAPDQRRRPHTLTVADEPYPGAAPDDRALLKKVSDLTETRRYLRTATKALSSLAGAVVKNKKAMWGVLGSMLLAYIVTVGSVALQQGLSAGWNNIDQRLFIILLSVPAGLLLLAAGIAGVCAFIRNGRVKNLLKSLKQTTDDFVHNASKLIHDIRNYLNTFITVFYNEHFQARRISVLNAKKRRILKHRDGKIRTVETFNALAADTVLCARTDGQQDVIGLTSECRTIDKCTAFLSGQFKEPGCTGNLSTALWTTKNQLLTMVEANTWSEVPQ